MEKRNYFDFESFDGEKFRYRQRDGNIFRLPLRKSISESKSEISFAINYDKVREDIKNSLKLLIINSTSDCNLRCGYCIYSDNYQEETDYKDTFMSLEVAKKSIDYLFNHSGKIGERIISFYGGEPLLKKTRPLIVDSVKYSKSISDSKNMPNRIAITTNGTTLTGWCDWMIKNDVSLFLSLDGPEGIHDKWRGSGSFKKIMDGINKIRKNNEDYFNSKVSFSSTFVNPLDLPQIREFFNYNFPNNNIRLNGVRTNGLSANSPLKQIIRGAKSEYENYAREYTGIVSEGKQPDKFLKAMFDQTLMIIYYRYRGDLKDSMWPTNICVPGGKKLFVKENGKFYACEKVYGKDFEIGDINIGVDFNKVKKLMEEYNHACNNFCDKCWAPRICGSCFMSIRKGENIDKQVMEEVCPNKLNGLELGLKVYTTAVRRCKKSIENYLNSLGYLE